MKSSGPLFTRQNPFPPASTAKRGHYHPSRKQSLSKKEKQITLSPVRLHPSRREKSDISASDGHVFTEIWPSGECESSPDSNADSPQMSPDKLSERLEPSTGPPGVTEDSVLAKYVERFRHGRPQSREERQQMASADGEEQMPFWWTAHSSGPSLTRTKSLEKDGSDPTAYSPAGQPQRDRSFNVVSDSSQGEFDETEILHLQERASKLLLRGECSPSDGDFPVSSDGVGCSDFSSPVSVDEPVRQTLIPSVSKPTAVQGIPEWARAAPFQKSVIPTMTPPTRPEDDILFQWRLRRKMEQARGWSQSMKQSGLQDSAFCWQAPSLVHESAGGQPYKQNSQPRQFSERDAYAHGTVPRAEITEAHRLRAPAPSPPLLPAAVVPSSSLTSQTQALSHVPAHMHLLCDVLPCPGQSSRATGEQTFSQRMSEPQNKVVHKKTQVSESLLGTNSEGLIKECRPPSPRASSGKIIEEGPSQQKVPDKKKKKKLVTKESDQKTGLPSRQQRKPARDCSNPSLPKNTTASKEQHQQDGNEDVPEDRCVGGHVPPSSPLHTALGQVVSEVLFPTVAQETPASSASLPEIISSPPQSPVPLYVTPNSLEVISRLIQEAEDSDGEEFEDDALLQVLRHQRKWVKDQIREVDVMLNELEEQPVA